MDEVERERRAPAEPGGAESLAAERVEVLAEPGVRHEAEAAPQDRVGLVRLAVLDQPVPEQPVRVDPDGPAPVPALVEVLGREVVRRDDVAVGPVRVEAGRAEVGHDRGELRRGQVGVEERHERDDRVLEAPLAADDVERAEPVRVRVPELVEQRRVEPLGIVAVRSRVGADDLGDLDERVR